MDSKPVRFDTRRWYLDLSRSAVTVLVTIFLSWVSALEPCLADTIGTDAPVPIEIDTSTETTPEPNSGEELEEQEAANPCAMPEVGSDFWLDRLHDRLWWSVCGSARWFDGFFGKERYDEKLLGIEGRTSVDVLYDSYDGWDFRGRFRVKIPVPNLDEKVDSFFGRDSDDAITDRDRGLDLVPGTFRESGEQDWLIGLGYNPTRANRKGDLDIKLGVKFRFPLEPFVKARYWRRWFIGESSMFRFRETVFWRGPLGFGATTNLEYEHFLGKKYLVRWRASGTVAEISVEGWEWSSSVTLYQGLNHDHALSYQAIVRGETKDPESLEEYGFSVTYRRRYLREWFFVQVVSGVTWPRELLSEERRASPHLGFGFEMEFGHDKGSWPGLDAGRLSPLDPGPLPPLEDPASTPEPTPQPGSTPNETSSFPP